RLLCFLRFPYTTLFRSEWILEEEPQDTYDYLYDQIVSVGELLSSKILAAYCKSVALPAKWVDSRDFISTDNTYREGQVNWATHRSEEHTSELQSRENLV